MKNPWLKKNPFMSMWLSGANTVLNSARAFEEHVTDLSACRVVQVFQVLS